MGTLNQRRTAVRCIEDILRRLSDIDCELAELVIDSQDVAEAAVGFTSHFRNDETDAPICVPEDANPELDAARCEIDELSIRLRSMLDTSKCPICDTRPGKPHEHMCPEDPDSLEEQTADLKVFQVAALRDMARERGIASSGNKSQLISRLLPIR